MEQNTKMEKAVNWWNSLSYIQKRTKKASIGLGADNILLDKEISAFYDAENSVKCEYCGESKLNNPGICPHCHRFPNKNVSPEVLPTLSENKLDNSEKEGDITPGPWRICGEDRNGCICGQIWSTTADFNVATAHMVIDELGSIPKEQMLANARLIASAPQLKLERDQWHTHFINAERSANVFQERCEKAEKENERLSAINAQLLETLEAVLGYEKRGADKGRPRIGNGILSIIHKAIKNAKTK